MGLFEFLKNKPKQEATVPTSANENNPPIGDIEKTYVVDALLKTPRDERDGNWRTSFLDAIQTASMACGDPQIIRGPDGFPYFVLKVPEEGKAFTTYSLRHVMDNYLLEQGIGVVINPGANSAEWVFSYGDLVNLHLNGAFFTEADTVDVQFEEKISKDEEVLVAQPSEKYLPLHTRKCLKKFLIAIGIEKPAIMMIMRHADGQLIRELAINIYREDMPSDEVMKQRMHQISWFLPRHYIVLSVPKNSNFVSGFKEL